MEESAAMALDEVEDVDVDGEIEGEVVHGRKAAAWSEVWGHDGGLRFHDGEGAKTHDWERCRAVAAQLGSGI